MRPRRRLLLAHVKISSSTRPSGFRPSITPSRHGSVGAKVVWLLREAMLPNGRRGEAGGVYVLESKSGI